MYDKKSIAPGTRFGWLTTIREIESVGEGANYLTECQCGELVERRGVNLRQTTLRGFVSRCDKCNSRFRRPKKTGPLIESYSAEVRALWLENATVEGRRRLIAMGFDRDISKKDSIKFNTRQKSCAKPVNLDEAAPMPVSELVDHLVAREKRKLSRRRPYRLG